MNNQAEQAPPEVPDFNLIRPIGSGGFGQVWLATNRTTGHLRAIKMIPLYQSGRANPAAREIGSLTRLEANLHCHHPNLLPIYHVGKTASHLFYVMDPADDVSGGPASDSSAYQPATLQSRLQNGPPTRVANHGGADIPVCPENLGEQGRQECLPHRERELEPEVCLDYAQQLLAGLASLHEAGMVHRDVKPANCLFVGGQLKLADFGLLTEAHPLVSRLGTQKYMPPDGRMDMRADVYAAGLVIYEMLSGLPVDDFPSLGQRAGQIAQSPILTALLRLVLRACERDPDDRFADAGAMLAELATADKAAPRLSRRRLLVAAAALVVLAAAGPIAWTLFPRRVDVNFVTVPYEAKIYLDDALLVDLDGAAYMTPCTVEGISAREYRVAFECDGLPRWDAGRYDFVQTQQIVSRRPK